MDVPRVHQQVHDFAETANRFCVWAEGAAASPEVEAQKALEHLSSLYRRLSVFPTLSVTKIPAR